MAMDKKKKEEEERKKEEARPHNLDKSKLYEKLVNLINEEPTSFDDLAMRVFSEARSTKKPLNLMGDSVLHEVIARKKPKLAVAIIDLLDFIDCDMLNDRNYYGDSPMHIAAEMGYVTVAKALLKKKKELALDKNRKGETPLHKAALFGHLGVFDIIILVADKSLAFHRTEDGSTILHYAIMRGQTEVALAIVKEFPELILRRNAYGASPLQLMADFFKKPTITVKLISLLHKYLTWEKEKQRTPDEESGIIGGCMSPNSGSWWSRLSGSKCWIVQVINRPRRIIVKATEETLSYEMKEKLIQLLVEADDNLSFYFKGWTSGKNVKSDELTGALETNISPFTTVKAAGEMSNYKVKIKLLKHLVPGDDYSSFYSVGFTAPRNISSNINNADWFDRVMQEQGNSYADDDADDNNHNIIWEQSPLITGIRLGADDFVIKILQLFPLSATFVDDKGSNVLQAAVKNGRRKVVQAIKKDRRIPQWLFTALESGTNNTLLHIAASYQNLQMEADPLCMQDELEWFEVIEKNVPYKELAKYRNIRGKTAQELFDEKHLEMLKNCRGQLKEIGRTCSALVAAVVFTSSFYIPGENNRESNRLAFKIFSHVYAIGFSCSAISLVMFLLLAVTPFKQQAFRKRVPWHYLMACFLLALSLVAFIVAFACNMYLQIYGEHRKSQADLKKLLLELLVPFLCGWALIIAGASWTFDTLKRLIK